MNNLFFRLLVGLGLLAGAEAARAAYGTNLNDQPFQVSDAKDHGCSKTASNVGGKCPECPKGPGMPSFWVSEPYINLWVADEPVAYTTSLGEEISFRLTYDQRDSRPTNGSLPELQNPYVPNTGWDHNWFSYVHFTGVLDTHYPDFHGGVRRAADFSTWTATLYAPGGGESYFSSSSTVETGTGLRLMPMDGVNSHVFPEEGDHDTFIVGGGTSMYGLYGFRLVYPDGSQDLYGQVSVLYGYTGTNILGPASAEALLTEHLDPYGNSVHYYYSNYVLESRTYFLLQYLVDYDGRTNTLSYSNNLLTRVDMPYGRSAQMVYDNGRLASITDAATNTSSFNYDGATGWLTNLTTPYGTTAFEHTDLGGSQNGVFVGNAGGTNRISRAIKITYPDQSKELYLYRYDSSQVGLPTAWSAGQIPGGTPLGTLDGGGSDLLGAAYLRNSYHWDAKQYAGLHSEQTSSFNSDDYALAMVQHWLAEADPGWLSEAVSWRREASPDGAQAGQLTWYDYPGKTNSWQVGTDTQVGVAAQVLPDGGTAYNWTQYNTNGLPATDTSTYTLPGGGIGTRTFTLVYTNLTAEQDCIQQGYTFSTVTWSYPGLVQVLGPQQEKLLSLSGFTNVQTSVVRSNFFSGELTFVTTLPRRLTVQVTNAVGAVSTAWFNQREQLTSVHLAAGLTRTNTYGTNGFLSKTRDVELSRSNSFVFANGLPATRTNVLGLATSYTWDNLQRLTSVRFPDASTVSNVYYRLDLTGRKDRLNYWSLAGYDAMDHLVSVTDARSNLTQLGWCGCGALTSITDPQTNTTTVLYNYQGLWTNILFADNSSLTCLRDSLGRPIQLADGQNRWLAAAYNNQGLLTGVSDASGTVLSVTWDALDRPIQVTDANNVTVTNQYDLLNRLTKRIWPDNVSEGFGWASNGLVAYTNRNGKVTRYTRDAAGRLAGVTNANLEITAVGYNALNELTDLWDGRTNHTVWHYDKYGWLSNKVDALNHEVLRYSRDANGQVTNRWTPQFTNTSYAYDEVGNLKTILYPQSSISLAYDADNRLRSMADAVGTTTFGYTSAGQLQSEAGPSATLTYGYTQGLRTSMSVGSLGFGYGYDSAWRLQTLTSPAGSFGYTYDAQRSTLPTLVTLPNGAWITNHYDSLARLDYTALVNPWGHVLDGCGYGMDLLGLRTNIVRDLGLTTSSVSVGYDNAEQITSWSAKESNGVLRQNEQFSYTYDKAGNLRLLGKGNLTETFGCDGLNQITNITDTGTLTVSGATPTPATNVTVNGLTAERYGDFTFACTNLTLTNGQNTLTIIAASTNGLRATNSAIYNLPSAISVAWDSNGNLTNDGARSFAYSPENELTNITVAGQWKVDFVHDGLGRRRVELDYAWQNGWVKTNELHFLYDGYQLLQVRDASNAVLWTLTRGLDLSGTLAGAGGIGGLLARTDGNGSTFYHADGAGNITSLMDGQQNMAARYIYSAFGRLAGKWGPLADANTMQFSSMPVHLQSGIVGYWGRGYDPTLQRWIQRDPIGEAGGMNLYGFVFNNPLAWIDPFGLDSMYPTPEQINANTVNNAPPSMALTAPVNQPQLTEAHSTGGDDAMFMLMNFLPGGDPTGLLMLPGNLRELVDNAFYHGDTKQGQDAQKLLAVQIGLVLLSKKCPTVKGTLTATERAEIQAVATKYNTSIDVVGSRAAGTGRNVETGLPVGKGDKFRSDIDFRIDASHPQVDDLVKDLKGVGNGAGSASTRYSTTTRPTTAPFIRFSPKQLE